MFTGLSNTKATCDHYESNLIMGKKWKPDCGGFTSKMFGFSREWVVILRSGWEKELYLITSVNISSYILQQTFLKWQA